MMNTQHPTTEIASREKERRAADDRAAAEAEREKKAHWRAEDEQKAEGQEAKSRADKAKEERQKIEAELGVVNGSGDMLAGGRAGDIEHAGDKFLRPISFALTGYTMRKITTGRGYEAVAYNLPGEERPALIDYGTTIVSYGATSQKEHQARAQAVIGLGRQKGWSSMQFWGGEEWLKASYLEAKKEGVGWSYNAEKSSYQPTEKKLAEWEQEAVQEKAPEVNPYTTMPRAELIKKIQAARRRLGVEFEDEGTEMEGPSCDR